MTSRTLLLVEDNAQDEALMLRALRRTHVANPIDVVRDGQQAVDYLLQQGEFAHLAGQPNPTVVLLDIGLPKLTGLEVLTIIRNHERTKHVPVVILTSSDEDHDRFRSYESGANSFVRKPLDFGEFAQTVANLGVYWLATNMPPQD